MTNDPNEARSRQATSRKHTDAEIAQKLYGGLQHFRLFREDNLPLEFDGKVLGQVEDRAPSRGGTLTIITRAALYQTRAGKYVAEFSRLNGDGSVPTFAMYVFAKVGIFDSRDVALQWFRKGGRLTLRLLEQLGQLESEFIE